MSANEAVHCPHFRKTVTEYLEGALPREQQETFESHQTSCGSCRDYLASMVDLIEGLGELRVDDLTAEREAELVGLIRRRRPPAEREPTPSGEASPRELLEELMAHSSEQRRILIENSARFRSVALSQLAIDRGFAMGSDDPSGALELTSLAALVADSLEEHRHPPGVVSDQRAKAYAFLGNARRIVSDLTGAAEALERASHLAALEFSDPSVKATVLALRGSLLGEQLNLNGAIAAFESAKAIFRRDERMREVVETSIAMAMHLANMGRPEASIEELQEIQPQADDLDFPRLSLALRHNLAFSLLACGRAEEARRLIPEVRRLHQSCGNAVDLTRLKWLEGQIAVDTGRLSEAESLFLEVKQFFVEREMAHDVGLVSLDLALVYLRQLRVAELKSLASEMLTIFRALEVHQEALAALAFCRKAMEVEQATIGLVSELAKRLEEARQRATVGVGLSVAE